MAVVIAESVPNFDLVMSIIGGTLTSPLIFMLPPLIYVKMLSLQTKHHQNLQESSFTNVILNKKSSMYGVSKYIEEKSEDDIHVLKNNNLTASVMSKFLVIAETIFCVLIVVCSLILTGLTTYFNLTNAVESYSNNTNMPCIYNVTMGLLYL